MLQELGIDEKDTLLLLNKVDRVDDRNDLAKIMTRYPSAIPLSARTGEGIEELHRAVSDALSHSFVDLDVEASVADGKLLAYLSAHGEVLERQYISGDRVVVHCRIPQRHLGPVQREGSSLGRINPGPTFRGQFLRA